MNKKQLIAVVGTGIVSTSIIGNILISNNFKKTYKVKALNELIDNCFNGINLNIIEGNKIQINNDKMYSADNLSKNSKKEIFFIKNLCNTKEKTYYFFVQEDENNKKSLSLYK